MIEFTLERAALGIMRYSPASDFTHKEKEGVSATMSKLRRPGLLLKVVSAASNLEHRQREGLITATTKWWFP